MSLPILTLPDSIAFFRLLNTYFAVVAVFAALLLVFIGVMIITFRGNDYYNQSDVIERKFIKSDVALAFWILLIGFSILVAGFYAIGIYLLILTTILLIQFFKGLRILFYKN